MSTHPVDVIVPAGDVELAGELGLPPSPTGLVLFAHGSGSSRRSPRNQHVARALHARGLATLLFDLLTAEEGRIDAIDGSLRFDIDLLTARLVAATDWASTERRIGALPVGYFGASTGAAAALRAAALRPEVVRAVVARGGRPDLARGALNEVHAPTLLIVGSLDTDVLALNRAAARRLAGPSRIAIVLGATHLFEEPGALDQVAQLAGDWLVLHLGAPRRHVVSPAGEHPGLMAHAILPFPDRRSAGRLLAVRLGRLRDSRPLVVGLPRGGVPVADEVARGLEAPLDIWISRKLGAPPQPELGLGAIAEGAAIVLDHDLVRAVGVGAPELLAIVHREAAQVRARRDRFRGGAPPPDVGGRTVIVVDDGIATGGTMRAAVRAIRRCGAARVVVAVPIAAPETVLALRDEADEVVCLAAPEQLLAIGIWYSDFRQVSDDEVVRILDAARARDAGGAAGRSPPAGADLHA